MRSLQVRPPEFSNFPVRLTTCSENILPANRHHLHPLTGAGRYMILSSTLLVCSRSIQTHFRCVFIAYAATGLHLATITQSNFKADKTTVIFGRIQKFGYPLMCILETPYNKSVFKSCSYIPLPSASPSNHYNGAHRHFRMPGYTSLFIYHSFTPIACSFTVCCERSNSAFCGHGITSTDNQLKSAQKFAK